VTAGDNKPLSSSAFVAHIVNFLLLEHQEQKAPRVVFFRESNGGV
jgi:hypothetical protein